MKNPGLIIDTRKVILTAQLDLIKEKAIDEAIIASVGDGLIATDKQGKITRINKAAQNMLRLKEEDVIGHDFMETVPAIDVEGNLILREKRSYNIVLATGMSFTNHAANCYVRSDGTYFPAAITTSPIIFGQEIIGAIITFRDNTREKEIDAMKTDFISVAAHQLRTPLGSMKWYLEMIMENIYGPVPPKIQEVVKNIYTANVRMVSLINDLLNVARIDELRVQDAPELCNIEKILKDTLAEKTADIQKRNIRIFFNEQNDPNFKINIDPKRLAEVFDNLLSNAIKYNRANGNITISVENINPFIKVTISDTGIGIPTEDINKITNKFFRANNAVRSETEGSGLGLFVVKSYVEGWGGRMELTSKENVGTTLTIYLPMAPNTHTLDRKLTK